MKDIEKDIYIKIKFKTIYLDEIKDIIEILKKYATKEVTIETEHHKIEDINELKDLNKSELEKIKIRAYKQNELIGNSILVDLNKKEIVIYSSIDGNEETGLVNKIENIINRNEKYILKQFTAYWPILVSSAAAGYFIIENLYIAIGVWSIAILLLVMNIYTSYRTISIVTTNKNDIRSFYKRKKDDIFLVLISVLLTASATALITVYLTKN